MIYVFITKALDFFFQALYLLLIIRVILSWIPHNDSHPIVDKIYVITDPMLKPFQNIIPTWKIGFDLSPLFAFLAISIIKKLVFTIL
jgi:YggT family protein